MPRPPTRKQREAWGAFVENAMQRDENRQHASTEDALRALEAHLNRTPRRPHRKLEQREQEALTSAAAMRWWWPGYRHHEQARVAESERLRLRKAGVRPGWPDVTLHIPPWQIGDVTLGNAVGKYAVLAALELKAERGRPTQSQLDTLRDLEQCGYAVKVAWGWQEAFAWLDQLAGPRPAVLPEGWADREQLFDDPI